MVLNTSYQYFLKHALSVSRCDYSLMKSAHKNVVTVPRVLVIRPSPYTSAFPREGSLYSHLIYYLLLPLVALYLGATPVCRPFRLPPCLPIPCRIDLENSFHSVVSLFSLCALVLEQPFHCPGSSLRLWLSGVYVLIKLTHSAERFRGISFCFSGLGFL